MAVLLRAKCLEMTRVMLRLDAGDGSYNSRFQCMPMPVASCTSRFLLHQECTGNSASPVSMVNRLHLAPTCWSLWHCGADMVVVKAHRARM